MGFAYLDASGNVLSVSTVERAVEVVQGKCPDITTRITGAPDELQPKTDSVDVNFYHQKTSGDGTDISHYAAVEYINSAAKIARTAQIDARTVELIAQGFAYNGSIFSLSVPAQINWIRLDQTAETRTYPLVIAALNDQPYAIQDATEAHAMVAAADAAKTTHIISGAVLKGQVLVATTQAAVDAVVDDRT